MDSFSAAVLENFGLYYAGCVERSRSYLDTYPNAEVLIKFLIVIRRSRSTFTKEGIEVLVGKLRVRPI